MSDVEIYEELDAKLTGISNRRDASKLWIGCNTYSQKDSLHSDWPLHLWAVSQMVPILFASAHVNQASHGAAVLLCTCSLDGCVNHQFVFPCLNVLF